MTAPAKERVRELYRLVGELGARHGLRSFGTCNGHQSWPAAGVYFFLEPDEPTEFESEAGRIVHIGTHAVKAGANTTIWDRLYQIKGNADGAGNHRRAVLRHHVGHALLARDRATHRTWGVGTTVDHGTRERERELEVRVSEYLSRLVVTYVPVTDAAGPGSLRAFIKRNAISVLTTDAGRWNLPSESWLGQLSPTAAIHASGLWNVKHVGQEVESGFDEVMRTLVAR